MSYITVTMHMLLHQWAHHDESIHMLERSCELRNSNYIQAVACEHWNKYFSDVI